MYQQKQLVVVAAAAATTEIVPAKTGRRILFEMFMDPAGANGTATLKSGSTAIGGALISTIGVQLPAQRGICNPGEALNVTMATASATATCRCIYSYIK